MNVNQINPLVLAYIGDAIYEFRVREHLVNKGINKVNDLEEEAKNYVSARSQSKYLDLLTKNNVIYEEEMDIVRRARNTKTNSHPKNTDILTYKYATGLEALIGYLYLSNKKDRMEEIINYIFLL